MYSWGRPFVRKLYKFESGLNPFAIEIHFIRPAPRIVRVWFYNRENKEKAREYVEALLKLEPERLYREGRQGDSESHDDWCFSVKDEAHELMDSEEE